MKKNVNSFSHSFSNARLPGFPSYQYTIHWPKIFHLPLHFCAVPVFSGKNVIFFLISAIFLFLFCKHTKDLPKWKYYSQFCTEYAKAPFLLSLFICLLCVLLFCKENVFCHIHELQISFSWNGRTDSSSFSSQQSVIPLLSYCLSLMFPPYLFLSPHRWAKLPGILDGNYILQMISANWSTFQVLISKIILAERPST